MTTNVWFGEELSRRFQRLDELLFKYEWLWKTQPFKYLTNAWQETMPDLAQRLEELSLDDVMELEHDSPRLKELLLPHIPELEELEELCQAGLFPRQQLSLPECWELNVKGRKRGQIKDFVESLEPQSLPYLEWCSGKGHLARLLARTHHQPAYCLELQPDLCRHGSFLAEEYGVSMDFTAINVLEEDSWSHLFPRMHALALHACGELHRHLIKGCSEKGVQVLSVSPCCYALEPRDSYLPFSESGRNARLKLIKDNVRIATQETVVAPPRVTALRLKNNRWRLAFDYIQRDLRGVDEYMPSRSMSRKYLHGDFETWARILAEREGLELPDGLDFAAYEEKGAKRHAFCSPLELPRFPFRRPVECWLLLDRALFLQESGYDVQVGLFCEKSSSPRNFLIHAEKKA